MDPDTQGHQVSALSFFLLSLLCICRLFPSVEKLAIDPKRPFSPCLKSKGLFLSQLFPQRVWELHFGGYCQNISETIAKRLIILSQGGHLTNHGWERAAVTQSQNRSLEYPGWLEQEGGGLELAPLVCLWEKGKLVSRNRPQLQACPNLTYKAVGKESTKEAQVK